MRILVVGNGGREHALVWKIAQSPRLSALYVAPGNPGMEDLAERVDIGVDDLDALVAFAQEQRIDLCVVGPELPLTLGIVDRFEAAGLRAFGPRAAAAELEGSKAFCKDVMQRHGIPTAAYGVFTQLQPALDFIRDKGVPIVVKASGLAAGKGVCVAQTLEEAEAAARAAMQDRVFGESGSTLVIEEFLAGEEASFLAFCDGKRALPMVSSQDHKQIHEGDTGPNTGGMGAYSPAPVLTDALAERALQEVMQPMVDAMAAEGRPFVGILYGGLMIDGDRIEVLEFNVRFGDPEAQPVLMRLETDIVDIMEACIDGRLGEIDLRWSPEPTICVVMSSAGYPGAYAKGHPIQGLDVAASRPDTAVFHAGTARDEQGRICTAGGRVLGVTARGADLRQAIERAYKAVDDIGWEGAYCRRDIGAKGVRRLEQSGRI